MALPERGARLSQRAPPNSTTAYALDAQRSKEGLGFRVRTPKDAEVQNEALERTAQIWLYVGSFAFIWIAIAGLAFSDDSGLHQFIVLGIGGGVSALLAVVFVEAQTVRRGVNAISMHDYLLGTGFFFAGVGGLWGARAIVGLLAASDPSSIFHPPPGTFDGIDPWDGRWHPGPAATYVTVGACFVLVMLERWYLNRVQGMMRMSTAVMALTPLAVLLINVNGFLAWSGGAYTIELTLAMALLLVMSFWLALESNDAQVFIWSMVTCGLVPFIYVGLQRTVGGNEAIDAGLSIMLLVILAQGTFAANERIRADVMERLSAGTVGISLLAMMMAEEADSKVVLAGSTVLDQDIGLSTALWLMLLLAYLPAVFKRRTPWMPIGLAAILPFLSLEASFLPWIITTIALPYLVLGASATRRWVGDATFVAVAIAYLIVEINIIGGGGAWSSVDPNEVPWSILGFDDLILRTMIPLVILATGLAGQRLERLSSGPAFIGCLAVVINPVALASVYATPLPWLVIGCIMFVTVEAGWRAGDELTLEQREGFTVYLLVALTATTIYVASGRFDLTIIGLGTDLTVRGFPVVGAILAGLAWFSGRAADELELGLNEIVHRWSSGTPDERPDRMELFRPSVLSAILIWSVCFFSVPATELASNWWMVLALAPVIAVLVNSVRGEAQAPATARAFGLWGLVIAAIPLSAQLTTTDVPWESTFAARTAFDLLMLAGPLIIALGLKEAQVDLQDRTVSLDRFTLLGLLSLACLDLSGGLLFIGTMGIFLWQCLKRGHDALVVLAPIVFLILSLRYSFDTDRTFLGLDIGLASEHASTAGWSIWWGIPSLLMLLLMTQCIVRERSEDLPAHYVNAFAPATVMFTLTTIHAMPSLAWSLLVLTFVIGCFAWYAGRTSIMPFLPIGIFLGTMMAYPEYIELVSEPVDAASYAFLTSGLVALGLHQLNRFGILHRFVTAPPADEGSTSHDVAQASGLQGLEVQLPQEPWLTTVGKLEGRESLGDYFRMTALLGLLLSVSAVGGIGTLIAGVWGTFEVVQRRRPQMMLALPMVHGMVLFNLVQQLGLEDIDPVVVGGIVAVLEGIMMSWFATRPEQLWESKMFTWEDEAEFYRWYDNLGISGMAYLSTGIFLAIPGDVLPFRSLVVAMFFGLQGVLGFTELHDSRWRRVLGVVGTPIAIVTAGLSFQSGMWFFLSLLLAGVTAFGFAMFYSQRLGDDASVLMDLEASPQATAPPDEIVDTPVQSTPVRTSTHVAPDSVPTPQPVLKGNAMFPLVPDQGLVRTEAGFSVRLPDTVMQGIRQALASTEHAGYVPVVSFNRRGEVVLDFEATT